MKVRALILSGLLAVGSLLVSACDGKLGANKSSPPAYCTPGAPGCVPATVLPGSTRAYEGRMVISDSATYRTLISDWNACYNDCGNWDDDANLRLEVFGTSLPAEGRVSIQARNNVNYTMAILPYSGTVSPTMNSTNFELRSRGGFAGYNDLFTATANVGNIVVGSQVVQQMRIALKYNNIQFGFADVYLRP